LQLILFLVKKADSYMKRAISIKNSIVYTFDSKHGFETEELSIVINIISQALRNRAGKPTALAVG